MASASASVAAALCGCLDPAGPALSSTAGISFEEYRATAAREPGTGNYIVDWDIVLAGDQALHDYWSQYQHGALTVYTQNGADVIWNATQKMNLSYCVSGAFGDKKQTVIAALQAATAGGWQRLANLRFVYRPTEDADCTAANEHVLFDVNPAPANPGYLARSFFPNSPRAERNILIAPEAFDLTRTGGIPLANILIHESGHILGMRHEHLRAPGNPCPEDNDYRAVTNYDTASTMHYPQCGSPGNTLALSQLDQQGISMIYGAPIQNMAPTSAITSPTSGKIVGPSFTVESSVLDTDLARAELYLDGVLYQSLTAAPFEFQVTSAPAGPHTLEVRGTDAANQTEPSLRVDVTVTPGGGAETDVTGGCSASGGAGLGLGLLGLLRLPGRRRRRG